MSQFATLPLLNEQSILLELRDAALHARLHDDYRWLQSASEVFLMMINRRYAEHQQLTERWRSYDNKRSLVKLLLKLCGRKPPLALKGHEEASRLLYCARLLRKAAQARDVSGFLQLCQERLEIEALDLFV
ncbi:MAG: hypothetical protein AAB534_02790 [Patescibacteria group bacterium]